MSRILIICLAILLYLPPFFHREQGSERNSPEQTVRSAPGEKSFYAEDFVNDERPGTICHVSSVCPAGEGKVACAWYEGPWESAPGVAIFFSVFDEAKSEWSHPSVLVDRKTCSRELTRYVRKVGNSLIYCDGSGRLWLLYSSVIVGGWSGSSLNYKVSYDSGKTWSRSEKMILSPFFNLTENVKNKGINLTNHSFVIPVYHELAKKYSQILKIETGGGIVKYEIKKVTHSGKAIQPSLIREGEAGIIAFFRNMAAGRENHILSSVSDDMGRTWSELRETRLPNPDSGFDMIKLRDGGYLGVINNTYQGRANLTLVLSRDKGKTWKPIKVLENKDGREYSYPSINRSTSGLYHVTYTYEKRRIKHIVFNEQWISEMEGRAH